LFEIRVFGRVEVLSLMLTGKKEFSTRRVGGTVVTRWGLINHFSSARENLAPCSPETRIFVN